MSPAMGGPAGPALAPRSWLAWLLARQARLALALAIAVLVIDVGRAAAVWPAAHGKESEVIARAVAGGHGFSFPTEARWLFDAGPAQEEPVSWHPTAWQEPLGVWVLAAAFRLLGEPGRLAMLVVNASALALTVWLAFRIGRRLPVPGAGLAAALVLALQPTGHLLATGWLGNSALAALTLTLVTLATLRCIEAPSLRRGFALGLALGAAALTHAVTLVLLPVVIGGLLAVPAAPAARRLGAALAALALAAVVVTPWILRNHAVFGELVLIRNGTGINAYLGNPALATAAGSEASPSPAAISQAWLGVFESGPGSSWLYRRASETVERAAPPDWPGFNEAQRDRLYLARALEFMREHPTTVLALAAVKLRSFLLPTRRKVYLPLGAATLLAAIGLVAARRSPQAWLVGLLVAAGTALFVLTAPVWGRYRFPIEPLISVLAGAGLAAIVGALARRLPLPARTCQPRRGVLAG